MILRLNHLGEDYFNASNNILLNTYMRAYRSIISDRYLGTRPIR